MGENNTVQTSVQTPPEPVAAPPKKRFLNKKWIILTLTVLVLIIIGATAGYYFLNSNKQVACTLEAKLCPDGSYVGRTGPNCEFVKCPSSNSDQTASWKTYTNEKYGFSFKYPSEWSIDDKKLTAINLGPLSTKNHIGEIVPEYVTSYIVLSLYNSLPNTNLKTFKNLNTAMNPVWKEVKIGEINGLEVLHEGCVSGDCREIIFQNDSTIYNLSEQNNLKELDQILSTFKFIDSSQKTALKIPEYGVQIILSDEIKDAYYINTTASKGYVYLKVHSLDSEPQCLKDDSSTAALNRVGKDDINPMTDTKYSESFKGKVMGSYFYYIDLAQYSCAESLEGKAKLEKVRSAFTVAEITQ